MYFIVPNVDPALPQVRFGSSSPPLYESIALDPEGPRSQTNLFVRKLASSITERVLQSIFEPFGTITSFALMRDIHTGESLGTAFVRYQTHEEACKAMKTLDGVDLYGRPISIQWAKKQHDGTPIGEDRKKIRKLFVRNIPMDVTSKQLRQLFSPHGSISNVTIHNDTAALPSTEGGHAPPQRNIAFILFHEDGAAEEAVQALHNACPFESCEGIPLMVKLAEDNRQRLGRRQKYGVSQVGVTKPSPVVRNAAALGSIPSADAINLASSSSVIPSLAPPYSSGIIPSSNSLPNYVYTQTPQNPYVLYSGQSPVSPQLLPPSAVTTSSPPGSYLNALDYSTSAYSPCFQAPMAFLCMGVDDRGNPLVQPHSVAYPVPATSQPQPPPSSTTHPPPPLSVSSPPASRMSTPRVGVSSNDPHLLNHFQLKLPSLMSLDTLTDPLVNFQAPEPGDAIQRKLGEQNAAYPFSGPMPSEITSFGANKDYEELINRTKGRANEYFVTSNTNKIAPGINAASYHDIFKPGFAAADIQCD
ncbi:unnamed protein product [Phytomonas sp. Hart1]|nr:unnamed protein product [Phytomonas sp. Hart1]|eukprot:CCW67373.1 unnamed protein product [Phytomonas sp. isolate Hart1]